MKIVIFTDLDGTLLHPESYSFQEALPALDLIRELKIPLVLCSSKTRVELELYRTRLRSDAPYISENGGGVFVPSRYFPFPVPGEERNGCTVVSLGRPYQDIRQALIELRRELRAAVTGFGDMTAQEIADATGLPRDEAELARIRDYSEPILFRQGPDHAFLSAAAGRGLRWTRGRLYCLMGEHDKGRAVRLVKKWYQQEHGKIITIGLGDAGNDLPLLQEVDHPVLVQSRDGKHDPAIAVPGLIAAPGVGPAGWNSAVLSLLKRE